MNYETLPPLNEEQEKDFEDFCNLLRKNYGVVVGADAVREKIKELGEENEIKTTSDV